MQVFEVVSSCQILCIIVDNKTEYHRPISYAYLAYLIPLPILLRVSNI